MPRPSKSSAPLHTLETTIPRRSTRISSLQAQGGLSDARGQPGKRRKTTAKKDLAVAGTQVCATECGERTGVIAGRSVLSTPSIRRSSRITPSELAKRENSLLFREQECKFRAQQLDERMNSLLDREGEVAAKLSQLAQKEAQNALSQLEEHFTCALCYEIMAYPYTLNPAQCGHTFCAICILKWFFSRLHRVCGGWHESVDCPICRSLLIITPDRVPRSNVTFPFVPNRVATAIVESLVDKLAQPLLPFVICGDPDASRTSDSDKEARKRKRDNFEAEDNCSAGNNLESWRGEGNLRTEWLKRDSDGKREMNSLVKSWSTLRSNDFLLLKQTLGV